MKDFGKIAKITGVYVGIIIGAGFASGKEIAGFFMKNGGEYWLLGMLLTGVLFAFLGWGILKIILDNAIETYDVFMRVIAGERFGKFMEWVSGIFLCILFFAMVAACGATFVEAFHFSYYWGVAAMLLCCFITFLFDERGVVAINGVLAPILIICGVFVGVYIYITQTQEVFRVFGNDGLNKLQWIPSALLYVSFNVITAVSVMVSLHAMVTSRRIAFLSGISGGLFMGLLGASIGAVLFLNYNEIKDFEIPMMAIVREYGPFIRLLYIFMLTAAIFTTAVGNGYGAVVWIEEKTGINHMAVKLLVIGGAGVFSVIGFSGFVNSIYPCFGYIGLVEIFFICLYYLKKRT